MTGGRKEWRRENNLHIGKVPHIRVSRSHLDGMYKLKLSAKPHCIKFGIEKRKISKGICQYVLIKSVVVVSKYPNER
jgi:hypothetical protein